MSAFRDLIAFGLAVAATALTPAAAAQTPSGLMGSASLPAPAERADLAGKWTCLSATTVEIAPVSFDARGLADAWVMVHRNRGEIVAAERISKKEVEQIKRMPCGAPEGDLGGHALLG